MLPKIPLAGLLLWLTLLSCAVSVQAAPMNALERERISTLIYLNECGADSAKLTSWNRGEAFASLGIGHFIWYPAGNKPHRFSESFPGLIRFMQQRNVAMPAWLHEQQNCPWSDRAMFLQAQDSARMKELRQWLYASREHQLDYIQQRLDQALTKMLSQLPSSERSHLQQQYYRVAQAPAGYYALMDYVNFKGEGINPKERYQGQGWGLLQVLQGMRGKHAIEAFSESAWQALQRRVRLSPAERGEQRWLPGWKKRIDSYMRESLQIQNNEPH